MRLLGTDRHQFLHFCAAAQNDAVEFDRFRGPAIDGLPLDHAIDLRRRAVADEGTRSARRDHDRDQCHRHRNHRDRRFLARAAVWREEGRDRTSE